MFFVQFHTMWAYPSLTLKAIVVQVWESLKFSCHMSGQGMDLVGMKLELGASFSLHVKLPLLPPPSLPPSPFPMCQGGFRHRYEGIWSFLACETFPSSLLSLLSPFLCLFWGMSLQCFYLQEMTCCMKLNTIQQT